MTRLYVGNIRFSADEASLRALFEAFGPVQEVYIGIDRETGRSRGFAFVTMGNQGAAQAAMNGLHGKEVDGRMLVVNEAQPRQARGPGGPPEGGGMRDRAAGRGGERGGSRAGRGERFERGGDAPGFRQPPYLGPPPTGGRAPKGGKQGGRDRDRDRDRDKQKFDQDDDW